MGNIDKAVGLTDYIVSLPSSKVLLSGILLVSIVFGFLLYLVSGLPLLETLLTGFYLLGVPGFLSVVIGKALMLKVPAKRIAATALFGEIIYALTYLIAASLPLFAIPLANEVIILGSAVVVIIWYIIARMIFVLKWRSLIFSLLQLLLYAMFLITNGLFPFEGAPFNVLLKFYLASVVLLGALYIFFLLINAPMKRTFGVASTEAISLFFAQWFYKEKGIEKAFKKVGEAAETYLSFLLFRRPGKADVAFVVPAVHFGPMGNVGGSNFSYLISRDLETNNALSPFVFHGTATHDLNPVSARELKKITDKCREVLLRAKPKAEKASLLRSTSGSSLAEALCIGDHAFIGFSRAPKTTEDISLGMGMALAAEAEKHTPTATIVDQHNAETGEIKYVEPGTPEGFEHMAAVAAAFSAKGKKMPLKMGIATGKPKEGPIGSAGIKVAIFGTSPSYAIILIDSNGITPQFRKKIMDWVESTFEKKKWGKVIPAVYTTDTHSVNTVRGVVNPLKENQEVLDTVLSLVEKAKADVSPAKFYGEKVRMQLNVLGPKQAIEIVSTVNAIVAVARVAAPLIIIGGIIVVLWMISKLA